MNMANVTDQEPVLELNGKKHIISELSPRAQYCIAQMNFIQNDMNKVQEELDRHNMAYEGFQKRLVEEVEPENTDEASENEE